MRIVVSADDEDVTPTISEAIEQAEEGETVFILPGEYTENLVIDKDIQLLGAGAVGGRCSAAAGPADEPIILIDGADPTISNFTVTGPGNRVHIVAATPTITEMVFREVGDQWWTYTGCRLGRLRRGRTCRSASSSSPRRPSPQPSRRGW